MRWPWRRRFREGGIVPRASAVVLREGGCALFPAAVIGTSYAPPSLSACALEVAGPDGICPYCGQPTPHPNP